MYVVFSQWMCACLDEENQQKNVDIFLKHSALPFESLDAQVLLLWVRQSRGMQSTIWRICALSSVSCSLSSLKRWAGKRWTSRKRSDLLAGAVIAVPFNGRETVGTVPVATFPLEAFQPMLVSMESWNFIIMHMVHYDKHASLMWLLRGEDTFLAPTWWPPTNEERHGQGERQKLQGELAKWQQPWSHLSVR
jgi:hypothetical protein